MVSTFDVVWWQRLLFGLGALIFNLLLTIALVAIHDFSYNPGLQWGNGGEIQMAGYILIFGGLAILATYVLFVVPLVLFWPVASQRKHWYVMLCIAMIWPPFLYGMLQHEHLSMHLKEIRQYPGLLKWPELFALCSCGCYLLLIHWKHGRLTRRRTETKMPGLSA